jgi:succinyl-diaminopimelate desuccinylase
MLEEIDADYGVVLEPTELEVHTASKGLAWYVIDIEGEPSHASRPNNGKNALEALLMVKKQISAYQEQISDRTHPLVGQSLCTPTMASAGVKENVIPESAELRIDRRFLPHENPGNLDEEINKLFEPLRNDGYSVSVRRTRTYEAAEIDGDAQIARVFRDHANEVADINTEIAGKNASTDQRNFVNDAGIPTIIWGPGTSPQSHTIDEWARTDLLYESIDVLCRVIEDLCTLNE